jgi:TCP-1/cpn60 chaperonin family
MCGTGFMVQVVEESVSDDDMVTIKGCKSGSCATVLLRGANDFMLDEMDRSLHDAFCIVKRVLESGKVVPGELWSLDNLHAVELMSTHCHAKRLCSACVERRVFSSEILDSKTDGHT